MVVSKTKYEASEAEIKELFALHKVGDVTEIAPLGNGEFNAAYKVTCDNGVSYALKIAPPENAKVLSYEKNMMESEVFWYSQMHEKTDILCPKVYASDFSKEVIKSNCFIMEMMEGEPLWAMNFSDKEYEEVQKQKICMLTKIHRITNDRFGYMQMGLMPSWYEALRNMALKLVTDCKELGYGTPDGEKFISLIDKHEKLLRAVPCRMVNFDLWDSNVLFNAGTGKICWIDPERGFWGDPVADFITLGSGQKSPLSDKQKELDIYNEMAEEKIQLTKDTEIRYALAVCYLALIEEVEKYVRYESDDPTYIRNTVDSRDMYDMAFGIL
ncbi:phosphotransferase family protein [Butyrivibrio sp. VCD2006]|uniref:phosphotransferase family protein n=1 Tax=Butyrivibrio sp. VCD2006 TaxID=1280664 RepID=UPI000413CCAA|nr:aminoglycoside phosphotransferase family protein [Butyrivibrio sp. VCD2006]